MRAAAGASVLMNVSRNVPRWSSSGIRCSYNGGY